MTALKDTDYLGYVQQYVEQGCALGMEVPRRATKRWARSHYHTDQSHAAGFSPTGEGCMIPDPGQAEDVLKAGGEEGYRWYLMAGRCV